MSLVLPILRFLKLGSWPLLPKDRGEECLRKETTSPEVLAKWVYEIFNKE